jgi:hypothetical protein
VSIETPENLVCREPVFVVGSGRSGTTMLQMVLNAHPKIAIMGEVHYFDQIRQLAALQPSLATSADLDRLFTLLDRVDAVQYLPDAAALFARVRARMEADGRRTLDRFYVTLLAEYGRAEGAERTGEKTPENVRYLDEIIRLLPGAKIIHIVRDPRDVVASLVRMPWTSNDVIVNALKWKCDVLYARDFARAHPGSYLEVRYENLTEGPEAELRRICAFLGEEYAPQMLDFYRTSKHRIKNEPWKEGTLRPINTGARRKWEAELSQAQAFIVEKLTAPLLTDCGYEPADISARAKWISPLVFCRELTRYIAYKTRDMRLRRRERADIIYGENRKLHRMIPKALFRRNG